MCCNMKAAAQSQELPKRIEHGLKFLVALFLAAVILGFCVAIIFTVLGVIVTFGDVANWLLRVRHDVFHHHYSFLRNWNLWSAAEWRLVAWLSIVALIFKMVILRLPLFESED
jgi:L-asparagine transporter-like permease